LQVAFTGKGVLSGVNVSDNGRVFITNKTAGVVYSQGQGVLMAKIGTATFTFQVIGHYGADGKLRDIDTVFHPKAIGNLAFLGNTVAIVKDEIDKTGNAITKFWVLK